MAFNKFLRLANGPDMPAFGLRTYQIRSDDVSVILNDAIEAGYRLFETSPSYNNQGDVGDVLAAWLNGNKIKREELFIVTNLPVSNNRPHEVEDTLKESLKLLKLKYVDLYLVEAPFTIRMENQDVFKRDVDGNAVVDDRTDHVAIWEIMEEMMSSGLTKSIGLGNFNIDQIQNIIKTRKMVPHVLQIEYHVYLQQPELVKFCKSANITLLTYAALGALSAKSANRRSSKEKDELVGILQLPEIREIAAAHKKLPAQVAFRWIIDKKMALTVKSSNTERIRSNIDIFDFSLTKEEMEKLNALNKNRRFVDFSYFKGGMSLTLNDGNKMPSIGVNTWNLDIEDLEFVIKEALYVGFRHIDTSVFNLNEKLLGKVLKKLIDANKVKRSDLFITTKLPPTANKPEFVEPAILQSLHNLQLEYIDLYLIQLPVTLMHDESFEVIKRQKSGSVCLDNTDHVLVWKKMEDLVIKGLVKSIGLANFNQKQVENITCNCNIPPAVLQIEYHIYLQQPELLQFCQAHRITITSFAALGTHDMLSSNYFMTKRTRLPSLLELSEVKEIAVKYKKTESQVLIRWILQKNLAALLRMHNSRRMHEIMGVYEFAIKKEDMKILDELDRNLRGIDFGFLNGPDYVRGSLHSYSRDI